MTFRLSRLAMLLAASIVVTALSGVVATYWVAQDEFRKVLDQDLENQSELLAEIFSSGSVRVSDVELKKLLVEYLDSKDEEALWITVYDTKTGQSVSNQKHDFPLLDDDDQDLHLQLNDHDWYGFQHKDGDVVVQILRQDERFEDVQGEIFEDITTPMLVVSGINLLLLAVLMGLVLWPLSRLSRQLEHRGAYSLEPLTAKSPAHEIDLLRTTLNGLMKGIDDTLQRERHFANDLAHEMRTPLTTLKLELANAAPDYAVMKFEVNRLAKVLEQLLTLARVEHGQWQGSFIELPLDELCAQELAALQPALEKAGIHTEQQLAPVDIKGDKVLLGVLLRNILRNVSDHCPEKTTLHLQLEASKSEAILRVTDSGQGMTAAQLERLNTGFSRLDSRNQGLGLGLAICRRIASVHQASLEFQARPDGLPGLQIVLKFPTDIPSA
jgi:signal transduction histidine kinase